MINFKKHLVEVGKDIRLPLVLPQSFSLKEMDKMNNSILARYFDIKKKGGKDLKSKK